VYWKLGRLSVVTLLVMACFALSALATDAEMYFSSDKNGQSRVTNVQEGDEVFIVVIDNDQNIDCDVRDKMGAHIKFGDPKTAADIVWDEDPEDPDWVDEDYLEETGADTGVFVSNRSFQIGARESFGAGTPWLHTHVADVPTLVDGEWVTDDFSHGNFIYADEAGDLDLHADDRGWFVGSAADAPTFNLGYNVGWDPHPPSGWASDPTDGANYMIGRFENMDTLVGIYFDPNDPTDVALALMKIIDTEATIAWDQEIYKDANTSATVTVVDADENVNCNQVEYVPVFILVNPGSWNPVEGGSPTNFCMLKRTGGVYAGQPDGSIPGDVLDQPIRWYNIYNSSNPDHLYYVQYPVEGDDNVTWFDTVDPDGITPVLFYAQETGVNTGVFQLNLNSILDDLGFESLRVRDVLVAYYLDPNDFDDFKLATAYIEEHQHSITSFTDATRQDQGIYWLGRDSVYVQVIDANANVDPCCPEQVVVHICDPHGEDDAEWLILDETSSNSPVFFTFAGTELFPVWNALGVGLVDSNGGFQLQLDNWKIEAFNEDELYVRYNDVYYGAPTIHRGNDGNDVSGGLATLGDSDPETSFPPLITRVRVANDVSFDMVSIADTQVYNGSTTNMYFLDRQGNRVSGYVNSDCVFVEVVDPDQDEDQLRRERIDGFWDGGQNWPFGPIDDVGWDCGPEEGGGHPLNDHLGYVSIFNENGGVYEDPWGTWPKLYVLNPRNGQWASVDLLETGVGTGDFVSVTCIDLTAVYTCVPTLGVVPGDTIVAFYQDPSNHSDAAAISIKVGIGGGGTPASQASSTMFVDSAGAQVANYTDADRVYVKVIDPSHSGASSLENAVTIGGEAFSLARLAGGPSDTFITAGLDLGLTAGDTITATYTDPTDPTDTSSDTITIIAGELVVESFYAGPNPFADEVTFGYQGSGIASVMSVEVYDLAGHRVWADEQANVSEIVWDGTNDAGMQLANGGYIYLVTATDGTNTFNGKGVVFVNR
jgi:hypothetical protein